MLGETVVSSITYCTGRNPDTRGSATEKFDPGRWIKGERTDPDMLIAGGIFTRIFSACCPPWPL